MLQPGFYNMDCMEALKEYPDKYFDLAIVDPPYGIGADNYKNGSGYHGKESAAVKAKNRLNDGRGKLRNRFLNKSNCSWDCEPPSKEYFDELFRVSKNQIIFGGNYFNLPPTRGIVVWDKLQAWENFSQVELAWTSFDKPAALIRMRNSGSYTGGKIHPTQKPVELYKWLLSKYAKKGDRILDTHVGSASSLLACHELGYEYTGFEINEGYYREASKRLEEQENQITIYEMMKEEKHDRQRAEAEDDLPGMRQGDCLH